jgi:hypothetical protein
MKIRPYAKCASNLPTDVIESDDGMDIIQIGGRSVAEAIAEDLKALDCTIGEVGSALDNGWNCSVKFQGRNYAFQVILIDDYYIDFIDYSFWNSREKPRRIFAEFLRQVGAALRRDSRLENLRWYVEHDDGSDGSQDPVTE